VPGDPQFRVVFDLTGLGSTHIQIGTFEEHYDFFYEGQLGSGVLGNVQNTGVSITVVP
jgi:hypothetical protein